MSRDSAEAPPPAQTASPVATPGSPENAAPMPSGDAVPELPRHCILQIVPAMQHGGVERGTVEVAEALVHAGARAVVASEGGQMVRELERCGAEHVELPLASKNPMTIRQNTRRLVKLIKALRPDIVHARSRAPAWSALFATQETGTPFVTTFHNAYSIGNPLKLKYNAVMAKGDRVIAISQFVAEHVATRYDVGEDRLRVIPRGVDTTRFDSAVTSPSRVIALAQQWRIPDDMPVIMLPGRLSRWKGHTVLIEALAKLGRKDVRCLIVGDETDSDRYKAELEKLTAKLNLQPVVHMVGHCRDMPAAYTLCDVVVSASTSPEGFGRVMAEAGALGVPVIATDHGAAPEIVLPGETGWLVKPGDPDALARALKDALSLDTTARERLSRRAKQHVRRNFTKDLMCTRTLQVYNELLQD